MINLRCASKALNWSRIGKIMLMTWNKFPFSKKIVPFFQSEMSLSRWEQVTVVTTVLVQGGGCMAFKICNSRCTHTKMNFPCYYTVLRWFETFFRTFKGYILMGHYNHSTSVDAKIMDQKIVQSLFSMLLSIVRYNN